MAANNQSTELVAVLRELLTWYKLINMPAILDRVDGILDTNEKKSVYQLTDGKNTTREIADQVGVNKNTVSAWWKEWARQGIVEPGPIRKDRPIKILPID